MKILDIGIENNFKTASGTTNNTGFNKTLQSGTRFTKTCKCPQLLENFSHSHRDHKRLRGPALSAQRSLPGNKSVNISVFKDQPAYLYFSPDCS